MVAKKPRKQAIEADPSVFWMIRRKKDGLFSLGGTSYIRWAKVGKVWPSQSRVLSHLRGIQRNRNWYIKNSRQPPPDPYLDAEVVQFRRTEEAKADVQGYGE